MWTFLASILFVCACALTLRNDRMLATAIVLLANWTVNTTIVTWLGDPYPWAWFLATDYLSGFVLVALAGRPAMWQVFVTVLFALECVAHGAFGLSRRTPWTEYYYWYLLSYTAWAQLCVIAAWGLCEVAGRYGWSGRRAPSSITGVDGGRSVPREP